MARRLNLHKAVKFGSQFLLRIGNLIKLKIREDALNGVFQNNTANHAYRSKQYMKYKQNNMRRLGYDLTIKDVRKTLGHEKVIISTYNFGRGDIVAGNRMTKKGRKIENKKLKGYDNRSVNTDISKVNMTLTGDTHKGMKVTKHSENVIEISWASQDYGKIKGNEMLGRVLVGLNDKNEELVVKEFLKEMTKQFDAEFPDKILL